jgi:hypothetical protein
MRYLKLAGVAVAVAVLSFIFLPKTGASVWDEATTFTFNQPVEIPGMVLPTGTYVFRILDLGTGDRNLVQVLDKNEKHVYGTFRTIEEQQLGGHEAIRFAERPAGSPPAIAAWFPYFAGSNTDFNNDVDSGMVSTVGGVNETIIEHQYASGHAFIYPKGKAPELSAAKR